MLVSFGRCRSRDEGRVDVDGVRHHRGAKHAGGEQDGVGPWKPGTSPAGPPLVRRADDQPGEETDGDDGEQDMMTNSKRRCFSLVCTASRSIDTPRR